MVRDDQGNGEGNVAGVRRLSLLADFIVNLIYFMWKIL